MSDESKSSPVTLEMIEKHLQVIDEQLAKQKKANIGSLRINLVVFGASFVAAGAGIIATAFVGFDMKNSATVCIYGWVLLFIGAIIALVVPNLFQRNM